MSRIFSLSFVCVIGILHTTRIIEAGVRFRNCILYFSNENLPEIEDGDRFCFQFERVRFCRETACPTLSCGDPQPPTSLSNCRFCPGQCVHGGNVYSIDERFKHTDGVNYCTCGHNNMLMCSKMGTNEQKLCNQNVRLH